MRTPLLSLLTILCLTLAVAPAMADTLYSNGAYNGTNDAWTINFGFSVSDSYSLSGGTTNVTGMNIVYWDASNTDLLTTVDYQFGSSSFSGNIHTSGAATNTIHLDEPVRLFPVFGYLGCQQQRFHGSQWFRNPEQCLLHLWLLS